MNEELTVLIIDDEKEHADILAESLEKLCDNAVAIYTAKDAVEYIQSKPFDVVITDLNLMDDINGMDVLEKAKQNNPECQVILITAYATIDTCKEAIRRGAVDYLVKPIDIDQLRSMVKRALKKVSVNKSTNVEIKKDDEFVFAGVKGTSPELATIFKVLKKVSPTNLPVVIEGESGTGKELLAEAIHNNSSRKQHPFKPINCAGLTESLLESELFGHAKGSFTGAASDRKGLFEIANKGTLFLDEIGDMPLNMQAKLLRVLEDGIVVPVGAEKTISVDVRIISATNHDLAKLVEEKKFRQDLFFRIKGVSITIPSLRQRKSDIPILIDFFIKQSNSEIGTNVRGISEPALRILQNYFWPGNIRQLKNCIKTMVVMCDSHELNIRDIPPDIYQVPQLLGTSQPSSDLSGVTLNELEKQAIIDTLRQVEGNREKAANILGIGERTLYRKIKEYDLQP